MSLWSQKSFHTTLHNNMCSSALEPVKIGLDVYISVEVPFNRYRGSKGQGAGLRIFSAPIKFMKINLPFSLRLCCRK